MKFASAWARTTGHSYVGIADAPIWNYNVNNLYDFDSIQNPDLRYNFRRQFASLSSSVTSVFAFPANWSDPLNVNVAPHGQHVAGIVAGASSTSLRYRGSNGAEVLLGTAGGCADCSIVLSGRRGGTSDPASAYAESLYALVDRGVQTINVSANAGTAQACNSGDVVLASIQHAVARDVLVVFSSGNQDSATGPRYPANCPDVLAVGAAQTATPSYPDTNSNSQ